MGAEVEAHAGRGRGSPRRAGLPGKRFWLSQLVGALVELFVVGQDLF